MMSAESGYQITIRRLFSRRTLDDVEKGWQPRNRFGGDDCGVQDVAIMMMMMKTHMRYGLLCCGCNI